MIHDSWCWLPHWCLLWEWKWRHLEQNNPWPVYILFTRFFLVMICILSRCITGDIIHIYTHEFYWTLPWETESTPFKEFVPVLLPIFNLLQSMLHKIHLLFLDHTSYDNCTIKSSVQCTIFSFKFLNIFFTMIFYFCSRRAWNQLLNLFSRRFDEDNNDDETADVS